MGIRELVSCIRLHRQPGALDVDQVLHPGPVEVDGEVEAGGQVEAQGLEPAPDVLAALRGRLYLPQPLQVGVQVVADADELGILANAPLGAQAVGAVRHRNRPAGDPAPGRQRLGDAHGDGRLASQHRRHLQAVEELGEEGRQIELRLGC